MNLNGLQISKQSWHAGLTQSSHLSNFYLTEPKMASNVVTKVFNMSTNYSTPLSFLTTGLGRAKELSNADFRWPLLGDDEKSVPVSRAFSDGGSYPGIGSTTFRIGFPEKWFSKLDYLAADNRNYIIQVVEDPIQDGSDFIYTCKLVGNDQTRYMPTTYIALGSEFNKEYNVVERDGSRTSGGTTYATPFMMQNTLTTLRKEYSVTGSVLPEVMVISMTDSKGRVANTWVKYAEWQYMIQWQREIERMLWYGQSNIKTNGTTDLKGPSGNSIYSGAGLLQQIAPSNVRYYTTLTERIIRDFMMDLSYDILPEGDRHFIGLTGEYGMDAFDQAMKLSASSFTLVDTHFITGSGQDLSFGGQFKTYQGLNGTKFTMMHNPLYDNTVINRLLHPNTGRPTESYRFTFLNYGINDGESNIQKVYRKDREFVQWYIPGSCDQYGFKKNQASSSTVDGYEMHCLTEQGLYIKNPIACAELRLDIAGLGLTA